MPPAIIAQLIIALGPPALNLIKDLTSIWTKDTVSPAEVIAMMDKAQKSYDDYIAEAKANTTLVPTA